MPPSVFFFFFFNDTATTEIYTLSLHDALPISMQSRCFTIRRPEPFDGLLPRPVQGGAVRSEEHTSELQSLTNLVCRLLLEKKKKNRQPEQEANDATRKRTVDARQTGSDSKVAA